MASQYWKMLFNAAWQAEVKLDEHIAKLKAEYRISDDEIQILDVLYRESLAANANVFVQQTKEEMKDEIKNEAGKDDVKFRMVGTVSIAVAIAAISVWGTIALIGRS